MRYFKVVENNVITSFGVGNDTIGVEITEAEYNKLLQNAQGGTELELAYLQGLTSNVQDQLDSLETSSISGTYKGTGSSITVNLGFRPKFMFIVGSAPNSRGGHWIVFRSGSSYGTAFSCTVTESANSSDIHSMTITENSSTITVTSTAVTINNSHDMNYSGYTYTYFAVR